MNRHPDQNAAYGVCIGLLLGALVWAAIIIGVTMLVCIVTLPAPLR